MNDEEITISHNGAPLGAPLPPFLAASRQRRADLAALLEEARAAARVEVPPDWKPAATVPLAALPVTAPGTSSLGDLDLTKIDDLPRPGYLPPFIEDDLRQAAEFDQAHAAVTAPWDVADQQLGAPVVDSVPDEGQADDQAAAPAGRPIPWPSIIIVAIMALLLAWLLQTLAGYVAPAPARLTGWRSGYISVLTAPAATAEIAGAAPTSVPAVQSAPPSPFPSPTAEIAATAPPLVPTAAPPAPTRVAVERVYPTFAPQPGGGGPPVGLVVDGGPPVWCCDDPGSAAMGGGPPDRPADPPVVQEPTPVPVNPELLRRATEGTCPDGRPRNGRLDPPFEPGCGP